MQFDHVQRSNDEEEKNILKNKQYIHSLFIYPIKYPLNDFFVIVFIQYWSLKRMVICHCKAEEPGHLDREVMIYTVLMDLLLCNPVLGQTPFFES